MKADFVKIKDVENSHQCRFKPLSFLHDGQIQLRRLEANNAFNGVLSDYVDSVFRPGIFKRNFIFNKANGLAYIPAAAMMMSNPFPASKILAIKNTPNLESMSLHKDMILVSCAGTLGKVRLIERQLDGTIGSQDIIRVVAKNRYGFIYALLESNYTYNYILSKAYGSVVPRLEPSTLENMPVPNISITVQNGADNLIQESARLREEAADELEAADKLLKEKAGLRPLTPDDYDYFGQHSATRKPSCFTRKSSEISSRSINAFNYSQRLERLKESLPESRPLRNILLNNTTFSTGSFPRIEVKKGKGVMLINQSDAFDTIINGKWISARNVNLTNLVSYGEVIVAGVGTLGENETFCRVLFANEDLKGQLISGEFIRMKTTSDIPSGFLYAWLSSDYGFRLIRSTQAGTKLCRPIPEAFLDIPVPILAEEEMKEIDRMVRDAHTKRHLANVKELEAIAMVEAEIEKWN